MFPKTINVSQSVMVSYIMYLEQYPESKKYLRMKSKVSIRIKLGFMIQMLNRFFLISFTNHMIVEFVLDTIKYEGTMSRQDNNLDIVNVQ